MNLVGKIFIVLIFVMMLVSLSFGLAITAAHTNHRARILRTDEESKKENKPLGLIYVLKEAQEGKKAYLS